MTITGKDVLKLSLILAIIANSIILFMRFSLKVNITNNAIMVLAFITISISLITISVNKMEN